MLKVTTAFANRLEAILCKFASNKLSCFDKTFLARSASAKFRPGQNRQPFLGLLFSNRFETFGPFLGRCFDVAILGNALRRTK